MLGSFEQPIVSSRLDDRVGVRVLQVSPIAANLASVMDVRSRPEVLIGPLDPQEEIRFDRRLVRIADECRDLDGLVSVDLVDLGGSDVHAEVVEHVLVQFLHRDPDSLLVPREEIDVVRVPDLMIDVGLELIPTIVCRLLEKMVPERKDKLSHLEAEVASDAESVSVGIQKSLGDVDEIIALDVSPENRHDDRLLDRLVALPRVEMHPVPESHPGPLAYGPCSEERTLSLDAGNLVEADLGVEEIL